MTDKLGKAVMLAVLVAITVTLPFVVFERHRAGCCPCQQHRTRETLKKLHEGVLEHLAENQGGCPRSLSRWGDPPVDAWHQPLWLICPGRHGLADVISAGPDHMFGTADDLHSWDP